jgi:hypothetical protein
MEDDMTPNEFRRHMLDSHRQVVTQAIRQARHGNVPDPWGVVVDVEDYHGRQFAIWLERGKGFDPDEAERRIDAEAASVKASLGEVAPTLIAVLSRAELEYVMPFIAPTGEQSVRTLEKYRSPNRVPVVIISRGGNTYGVVEVQA